MALGLPLHPVQSPYSPDVARRCDRLSSSASDCSEHCIAIRRVFYCDSINVLPDPWDNIPIIAIFSVDFPASTAVYWARLPHQSRRAAGPARDVMKNEKVTLDEFDVAILEQLQRNCRQTIGQIASKVHLSTSACHRRIKALEESGVITNYVAKLASKKLGYSVEFFVELSLATQKDGAFEEFEKAVRKIPEVLECYLVGGQYDYLLRVLGVDAEDYERIHRESISRLPGVTRIQSILSLRTVKANHGLPV